MPRALGHWHSSMDGLEGLDVPTSLLSARRSACASFLWLDTPGGRCLSSSSSWLEPTSFQRRLRSPGSQANCKVIAGHGYVCPEPKLPDSKPKLEVPEEYARSFEAEVGALGELTIQGASMAKKLRSLTVKAHQRFADLQIALSRTAGAGIGSSSIPPLMQLAGGAAKEADEVFPASQRVYELGNEALKHMTFKALSATWKSGKDEVTEPLLASLEAVRGPRALITPWSSSAAHPPGMYCQQVCHHEPPDTENT
eukprot:TRINITY_DN65894_c0_g1_i1.p1 TRINITY_DN65894_c0_g1~~TRINITY_DN65894_c0_g1_i1.p1  ORF type:complete len:254 (+),score=43.69 TRINITY_DN65894_c0_g1_i1:76-837(+)